MDNGQKAIMIGVSLFITIIIISAVLLIVNLGTGLTDDAAKEIGTMSTSLQKQIREKYNDRVISGTEARGVVQQYLNSKEVTVVIGKKSNSGSIVGPATVGAKKLYCIAYYGFRKVDNYFVISLDEYENPSGNDNSHFTSMSVFDNISNASRGTYIDTSKKYKACLLKLEGTDVIVGIVFYPYE